MTVLDVGGRHQPYRPLLQNRVRAYYAVDLKSTPFVDVIADGQRLPFSDAAFDLVISTQVFDCFTDPLSGARESFRVLKPGGVFLLSVPAFAPRFAEYERWRFFPSGLKSMLSDFENVEIVAEVSSAGGLLRTINLAGHAMCASHGLLKSLYEATICPILNVAGLVLRSQGRQNDGLFTPNYSVRAVRPRT